MTPNHRILAVFVFILTALTSLSSLGFSPALARRDIQGAAPTGTMLCESPKHKHFAVPASMQELNCAR